MNAPSPSSNTSKRGIDLDLVTQRARRAYELGRLASASRILWWLVPLVVLAAVVGSRTELCACVGVVLVGGSLLARWHGRALGDAATHGVFVGSFVTAAGLGMNALLASCAEESLASICGALCALSGAIAGYSLVRLSQRVDSSRAGRYFSVAIATVGVTALLGCSELSGSQWVILAAGLLAVPATAVLAKRFRRVAIPS